MVMLHYGTFICEYLTRKGYLHGMSPGFTDKHGCSANQAGHALHFTLRLPRNSRDKPYASNQSHSLLFIFDAFEKKKALTTHLQAIYTAKGCHNTGIECVCFLKGVLPVALKEIEEKCVRTQDINSETDFDTEL